MLQPCRSRVPQLRLAKAVSREMDNHCRAVLLRSEAWQAGDTNSYALEPAACRR